MGHCTPTIWYRFRRWLVRKLVPPNMTVFCFDGMENIGGSNLYDPVFRNRMALRKATILGTATTGSPESGTLVFTVKRDLKVQMFRIIKIPICKSIPFTLRTEQMPRLE